MEGLLNFTVPLLAALLGAAVWILLLDRKCRRLQGERKKSIEEEQLTKKREEIYDAMLPMPLLRLFQKGDLGEIRIGEEKSVRAAVQSFNMPGFSGLIRSNTAEEIFGFVNHVLEDVVPCVLFQEGVIDKYVKAGLTAFYLNEPERALQAAVSVCETLSRKEELSLSYSIGLSYGDVMVGMVGHERRFGVLTISETTGIAEFLQKIAGKYKARILITGSLKRQISDFERHYNSRYLGCIYLKTAKIQEDVYDVFDGDEPGDKNGKRRTRLLFEKGVDLFQKRKFYDARLHFIEVLKANRMDGAAREYLYLCNQYYTRQDTEEIPVYLEVY